MPKDLHARQEAEAARRPVSKSAILRDTFAQRATTPDKGSLHERIKHLIGSIDGPGDLSARSKKMEGYGRSRRP